MALVWLRPARPAGAVLLAALLLLTLQASSASADPNELRIEPASVEVAPGGTTVVSLVADPPATDLSVWGIDILYDPAVVTTNEDGFGCDTVDPFPNSTLIGVCLIASSAGEDGPKDVVKILGAMVWNRTEDGHQEGDGINAETVLADITFDAVGQPGTCSDLRLFIRFHSDHDAQETNPQLFDGEICIEGDAPPSGTAVPKTVAPRTSDPTAPGGDVDPPTIPDTDEPGGGDETPGEGSEGASPGESGSNTGFASSDASQGSGDGPGGVIDEDDDGGVGFIFWAALGIGALLVVSGVAWAVVRRRGVTPDGG